VDVGAPREEAREGARHHDRGGPAGDEAVDPEDRRDRAAAEQAIDAEHPHVERGALRDRGAADRVGEGVGRVRLPAEPPPAVDPEAELVVPAEDDAGAEDAAAAHAPDGAARVPVDEAPDGPVELEPELVAERGVHAGLDAVGAAVDAAVVVADHRVLLDVVPLTRFDAAGELLLRAHDRQEDAHHAQVLRAGLAVGPGHRAEGLLVGVRRDPQALSEVPIGSLTAQPHDRVAVPTRETRLEFAPVLGVAETHVLAADDDGAVVHAGPGVGRAGVVPARDRHLVGVRTGRHDRGAADTDPLVRGVAAGLVDRGAQLGERRVGHAREALVAVAAGVRRVAAVEVRNQLRAGGARDQHGGEKGDTEGRAEHHGREPLSGGVMELVDPRCALRFWGRWICKRQGHKAKPSSIRLFSSLRLSLEALSSRR
jgi:hypothetical protein